MQGSSLFCISAHDCDNAVDDGSHGCFCYCDSVHKMLSGELVTFERGESCPFSSWCCVLFLFMGTGRGVASDGGDGVKSDQRFLFVVGWPLGVPSGERSEAAERERGPVSGE